MMGTSDPQPSFFYNINLEQFVTADHPILLTQHVVVAKKNA